MCYKMAIIPGTSFNDGIIDIRVVNINSKEF